MCHIKNLYSVYWWYYWNGNVSRDKRLLSSFFKQVNLFLKISFRFNFNVIYYYMTCFNLLSEILKIHKFKFCQWNVSAYKPAVGFLEREMKTIRPLYDPEYQYKDSDILTDHQPCATPLVQFLLPLGLNYRLRALYIND